MKNFFYLILAVSLVVLTSVTTVSITTVKPATPKSVVVYYGVNHGNKEFIRKYSKMGYIVKTTHGNNGWSTIVMEKY